ncbi:MAG: hypothetical protein UY42_C0022G0006 [Parcubacteria group bacterium GW2011_GWA2_49_16]|nr:MAG: hypothetical protein UY42_C0022G0006 [Parcubacteria group bacterium GW2011_GWA2_49_16]
MCETEVPDDDDPSPQLQLTFPPLDTIATPFATVGSLLDDSAENEQVLLTGVGVVVVTVVVDVVVVTVVVGVGGSGTSSKQSLPPLIGVQVCGHEYWVVLVDVLVDVFVFLTHFS